MISRLRDGSLVETYDGEGKIISFLYGNQFGKCFLKVLIGPAISKFAGLFLDSSFSKFLIKPFIKKNQLDLSDYPKVQYHSFNDFFTRKIRLETRPFVMDENVLTAPCDGKVTVFKLSEDAHFIIKGCDYTLHTLLRDEKIANQYLDGYGILFRLTVDDYHRFYYPVSGMKSENVHLEGYYHTVHPTAARNSSIYQENVREYTQIKTEKHGNVLMMEIGAMLVGRIKNFDGAKLVKKKDEKGTFEFGGSSIILLVQKDRLLPDEDLLVNSKNDEETVVKLGESIGKFI